jgi:putative transposase
MLLSNYPAWQTVFWYFQKWTNDGTIELAHQEIRKELRKKLGKNEYWSVGIIDSSSVRMNATTDIERWIDGNKGIKGFKRLLIVDKLSLLVDVVIH